MPEHLHGALRRPSAVEDIIDQHDNASLGSEFIVAAFDGANRIARTIEIDQRGGNFHPGPFLDQMTNAHAEQRAAAYHADDCDRSDVTEILDNLIGERINRAFNFIGIHDFALGAALVRLVACFFGLLDAVENRERSLGDPVPDVVGEAFVVPLRLGVVVWAGLYLRDERIRALLPLRKSTPQ